MWFYENLEPIVGGIFASGVGLHFATRQLERRKYLELRAAYEDAVREARDGDRGPAVLVHVAEVHRAFMNSWLPGWFDGFDRCVARWLKFCAVFILVAFFFKGPIERGEEEYAKRQARAAVSAKAQERLAGTGASQR